MNGLIDAIAFAFVAHFFCMCWREVMDALSLITVDAKKIQNECLRDWCELLLAFGSMFATVGMIGIAAIVYLVAIF